MDHGQTGCAPGPGKARPPCIIAARGLTKREEISIFLLSLIPFKTVGLPLLKDVMDPEKWDTIARYLDDPVQFQDKKIQMEIAKLSRAA